MSNFVGIDLGTTFSAAAYVDNTGKPTIIEIDNSNIVPSCVAEDNGDIIVGEFSRLTWGAAPEKAAARFKRDMGTNKIFSINNKEFNPTELSSFVLKKIKKVVEHKIGYLDEVVVTIPANFAHEAREATMAAAKIAGLNINYIINEPTAAALYYAYKQSQKLNGIYAVYDLGGGTFDVSIIKVQSNDVEVLASNGVTKLGGDDFDKAIFNLVKRKFLEKTGKEITENDFSINDAEEEKKSLSYRKKVVIRIGRDFVEINREDFENEISSLLVQTELLCETTIDEANITSSDINGVFLAGGSTRIPKVMESIKKVFKSEPIFTENVDEVVALGAALYAAIKGDRKNLNPLQKQAIEKLNVEETTSKCFGTISLTYDNLRNKDILKNSILIKKGDKIPCSVSESFFTMHDNQTQVNCRVTESTSPETDPKFVKVIWQGDLELPPNRTAGKEIRVTYSYDANQIMSCSFLDVETNKRTDINLSMTSHASVDVSKVNKFMVE